MDSTVRSLVSYSAVAFFWGQLDGYIINGLNGEPPTKYCYNCDSKINPECSPYITRISDVETRKADWQGYFSDIEKYKTVCTTAEGCALWIDETVGRDKLARHIRKCRNSTTDLPSQGKVAGMVISNHTSNQNIIIIICSETYCNYVNALHQEPDSFIKKPYIALEPHNGESFKYNSRSDVEEDEKRSRKKITTDGDPDSYTGNSSILGAASLLFIAVWLLL